MFVLLTDLPLLGATVAQLQFIVFCIDSLKHHKTYALNEVNALTSHVSRSVMGQITFMILLSTHLGVDVL